MVLADGQNSDRQLLKSWSTETGKERLSIPLPLPASSMTSRPTAKGAGAETVYQPLAFLTFDRAGTNLLVSRLPIGPIPRDLDAVTVIDPQTGKIRATVDHLNGAANTTNGGRVLGPTRYNGPWQPMFTADGSQFVIADDNVIRTFDTRTGKLVLTLRGHENAIAARAEGPDGSLWSVEADGTLKQWSLEPPTPVQIASETGARPALSTPSFALSADGGWVARVHVEMGDMKDEYNSIVEVWDATGKIRKVFEKRGERRGARSQFGLGDPTAVALSADGRRVALLRPPVIQPMAQDEKIHAGAPRQAIGPADLTVWDVGSGKEIYHAEMATSTDAETRFSQPTFTSDGMTMSVVQAVRRKKTSLRVFDVPNCREKPIIDVEGEFTRTMLLSPDGQRLAVKTWDPQQPAEVSVYDLATGKKKTIDARVTPISGLIWCPDSKKLLVTYQSGSERELNLYDTVAGKLAASLSTADQLERRDQVDSTVGLGPVFSPDGRRIAIITNTRQSRVIKICDTESGKDLLAIPLAPTQGPGSVLYHLAFTPDMHGLRVVTTRSRQWGVGSFPKDMQFAHDITVTTYDATPRQEPVK